MPNADSHLTDQRDLYPELDRALAKRYGWESTGPTEAQAERILKKCSKDPEYFIFGGFVRTSDPHDRDHPVKPFPNKDYLREILRYIHAGNEEQESDVVAISKSRQLSMTWLACAYAIWEARFHPQRVVMIQSKKAEDAYRLVFWKNWIAGRCSLMERAMPSFLRAVQVEDGVPLGIKATRGELVYPNGSIIMGIPEGGHQFRSHVASLVISDECCFQPEFEDSFTAALAMSKNGGKIVLITTAAAGTYYARLVEEEQDEMLVA
jgi:hypothetical protein